MKTIRDTLNYCIKSLKTNIVLKHIEASIMVYTELSAIKGFDIDPLNVFAIYQRYLTERHKSFKKVGFWEKMSGLFKAMILKIKLKRLIKKCQKKQFGDGDKMLQEMFNLIWKVL
jgi:hypothetical protein